MTGPVDRDRQVEELLRQALPAARPTSPCLDGERLAAWVSGGLGAAEAVRVEQHLSGCADCQAMLAVFAESEPTPVAAAAPFWSRWRLRWLVPVAAASTAVFVWAVATREHADVPDAETTMARVEPLPRGPVVEAPAAAPAPEFAPEATAPRAAEAPPPARVAPGAATEARAREFAETDAADALAAGRSLAAARQESARPEPPPLAAAEGAAVSAERGRPAAPLQTAAAPPPPPAAPPRPESAAGPVSGAAASTTQAGVRGNASVLPGSARLMRETVAVSAGIADTMIPVHTRGPIGAPVVFAAPAPAGASRLVRWRLTLDGRLERTADGGASWTGVTLPQPAYIIAGSAPAAGVCWIAGREGVVMVATGDGAFARRPIPVVADVAAIEAIDALRATATTLDGRAFVTEDGGATWRPTP